MKKIFIYIMTAAAMAAACQEYDHTPILDKLNEYEERIEKLEELCKKMNTNISALQTIVSALQDNDYVTGIAKVMEGGEEIGYMITFSKSGTVTIYHGQDGVDGLPGQDGTPGQDGADGLPGQDGADGKDGVDGKDGHSPVIGVRQDADGVYYWTLDG
jgi:hypothetical protein